MGRRPNPIILEYFDRGNKLADASNRYAHSCKSCNENFPKGRADSLVNHLTKKCPALSVQERTKIVLRLHDLGDGDGTAHGSRSTRLEHGRNVSLPYTPSRPQNFNALNVLAEASRQVGATEQRPLPGYTAAILSQEPPITVDPDLDIDPFSSVFLNAQDENVGPRSNSFSMHGVSGTVLPSIFPYLQSGSQNGMPENTMSSSTPPSGQPHDLSTIAASASETLANVTMPLEPDMDMTNEHISAALLSGASGYNDLSGVVPQPKLPLAWSAAVQTSEAEQTQPEEEIAPANMGSANDQHAPKFPRPIAMNPHSKLTHFVKESGTRIKTNKPKVRQRFTDDRRKEVQQIRQQGACLRCNILRKPCSGGTPCTACRQVESARVWKHGCIRTRLGKIFTLFSVNLHNALAMHDRNNIIDKLRFDPLQGQIELSHSESGSVVASFNGIVGTHASTTMINRSSANNFFMLEGDIDSLTTITDHYIRDTAVVLWAQEKSQIMGPTLATASRLSEEHEDEFLREVLMLWTATYVLTDITLEWKIEVKYHNTEHNANTIINESTNHFSHSLILSQLRATVEKLGGSLSTSIMKKIQKRLMENKSYSSFQTFLLALVLLNSIERYCWLFRTWSSSSKDVYWPLDTNPEAYAEQGTRFSEIMHILLHIRALPPRVVANPEDGILKLTEEKNNDESRQWLSQINITQAYLDQLRSAEFDVNDSRSMDGKFFASLLMPQAG